MSQTITHSRAFELLPWLVNGSLGAEERDAVEQHVRSCLACHRELKEQQRLRAALRAQPAVHLSPQSNFDKLARALDRTAGERAARPARGASAPLVRFAAAAAVGAACRRRGAVALAVAPRHSAPTTRRSRTAPPRAPGADRHRVRPVGHAGRDAEPARADRRRRSRPGRAASGVTASASRRPSASDAELDALLAKLGKDPRVRFAASRADRGDADRDSPRARALLRAAARRMRGGAARASTTRRRARRTPPRAQILLTVRQPDSLALGLTGAPNQRYAQRRYGPSPSVERILTPARSRASARARRRLADRVAVRVLRSVRGDRRSRLSTRSSPSSTPTLESSSCSA